MLHGSCFYSILNSLYKLKLIRMKMIVCSRDATFVCGCPLRAIPEKNTWEGKTAGNIFFYGWLVRKVFKLYGSKKKSFCVAFPWVETSTGPGGFMICVFII